MKSLMLILLCALHFSLDAQLTVYAEAGSESGRGIVKSRGNECFAIIPNHLLRDHFGSVAVYGEGSVLANADFVKSYNSDLAILRFEKDNDLTCTEWKLDRDYQKVIDVITKCKLEMREKTGGVRTMAMTVTGIDDQFLYVQPDNFREKIAKGMSGSSLFAEYNGRKVYLGMLQSVDNNTGEILMADEMESTLSEFFNPRKKIVRQGGGTKVSMGIVRESSGYKFELLDIERSGSNVTLKFDVVSLNRDNDLQIHYRNISLFDDKGLETNPANIIIGSQSGGSVNYNMIHGVSIPMELSFKNISSSATSLSLLKFNFKESRNDRAFEIRDIELPGGTSFGSQFDGNDIEGVKTISGFKYELMHVDKNGQEVICKFMITSMERDRELSLHYRNILLSDDKGFESNASNIIIGNKSGGSLRYNMVHGVPVPLELKFTTVNSSAENIALLKIPFQSGGSGAEYQQRNISFESSFVSKSGDSATSNTSGCSEIYFYRMKGIAQCPEDIEILNHGESILKLEAGTRYKAVVCDDREFAFKATIGETELLAGYKKPKITLGENYYFKVGCTLGTTIVIQQDKEKGQADLNKSGKYKKQIKSFQLNDW